MIAVYASDRPLPTAPATLATGRFATPYPGGSSTRWTAPASLGAPDVSTIPPNIPQGGFSPLRLKGWRIRWDLPDASISLSLLPAYADLRPVCLHPSCFNVDPRRVGSVDAILHRHAVEYSTYPRGPRSRSGYAVPSRHHLIDPIRPTRRHIAISPHSGLYAMSSLCGSA